MRLACVIPTVGPGGAQRVLALVTSAIAERGVQVSIISFDDSAETPFFPLHPSVALNPLGLLGVSSGLYTAIRNNVSRVSRLRAALEETRPDIVLSFCDRTNVVTILAAWPLALPVVVAERSNPYLNTPPMWRAVRRLVYPLARRVVVQTCQSARAFAYHPHVHVIPNPVPIPQVTAAPPETALKRPCVIGLGRFASYKRFDLLIDAFARASEHNRGWSLLLIGDGPERSNIERRIKERGIVGSIRLAGYIKNSEELLSQADLFVLCSDYEGFPMALCEAMACGVAVIATNCPDGPGDIVRHGHDGLLVPCSDVGALTSAMGRLMENSEERTRLASRAREICTRFAPEQIYAQWETALSL